MRCFDKWFLSAVLAAAAGLAAGPAAADWLVTRDGAAFEIKGEWQVKGRTVVFTLPNGTLSSMNAAELDLDRSRELTVEKKAPPPAAPRPAPKPAEKAVLTLGPDDVPRARSAPRGSEQRGVDAAPPDSGQSGEEPAALASPASFFERLEVSKWQKNRPAWLDGVELTGELTNLSDSMASNITLQVTIHDQQGQPIETRQAFLDRRSLLKGRSLGFRVPFEGVSDFGDATFDVSATEVVIGVGTIDAFDASLEEDESGGR